MCRRLPVFKDVNRDNNSGRHRVFRLHKNGKNLLLSRASKVHNVGQFENSGSNANISYFGQFGSDRNQINNYF